MNDKIKNKLKDNFDVALNSGATVIGSVLSDTLVGQVAPGVVTAYLSYKQVRTEKNIMKLIEGVKEKQNEFDQRLSHLEEGNLELFRNKYFPMVMDYVIDEPQERKIEYIINGLMSIASVNNLQEDFLLTYYDLLKELRLSDLLVLYLNKYIDNKSKYINGKNQFDFKNVRKNFQNKTSLNDIQINYIEDKLVSKGLMTKLMYEIDGIEPCYNTVTKYGDSFIEFFNIKIENMEDIYGRVNE